ncbi:hypothetical protein BZZ01_21750 [Nostocales cyanobacterium HT-58-2]|nr:hypothetical protein BZZ01_21750 [Nostocales cyanobacterium HT-58-2]
MTQSVADKTPIPEKVWRRHTDPPSLWIAVATISVTLHLLLFWLLRSHSYSLLQRSSSNPIPVEFVEISPRRKTPSQAKPVLPTRSSTTQKSAVTRLSKPVAQENLTAKSNSTVEDNSAIALRSVPEAIASDNTQQATTSQPKADETTQQSTKKGVLEQEEAQPNPQPIATTEPTPSPTIPLDNENPEPTPSPTTPLDNESPLTSSSSTTDSTDTDTQNQANQELGEDNQASNPQNSTTDSTPPGSLPETTQQPQPSNEVTQTPSHLPGQPGEEVIVGQGTSLEDIAPPVKPDQSAPMDEQNKGGIALATWQIDADAVKRDRQGNPPQIVGDISEKELDFLALNKDLGDQPIEFKAVLLIDSNGDLNSIILYPKPKIPEPQATQYQEYAEAIFKGQKFIPASNNNGNKPPLGELVVNIKIQRKSPNSSVPSP